VKRGAEASAPIADFNGIWKNGLDSEMKLIVSSDGLVKGTYKTGVGKPGPEEVFELTGFAANDIIGFTVNFGKYGSITSWVGQHSIDSDGNPKIYTFWHLAKDIEDNEEPENLWSTILTGSNTYFR